MLERLFRLRAHGSNVRSEVIGGATTFVTMAYIIVVNPAILAAAGIPPGPSTVATVLAAALGTLAMGLYANRPLAVAPYMGENAFLAFGLQALGISWQQRLGSVFLAGVLFLALTLSGLRGWLARSISVSMQHAFAAGIGLFLAFIGLQETGIVTNATPPVPVKLGNLHDGEVLLAIACFLGIIALLAWRVPGAILIGIATTAAAGIALGFGSAPVAVLSLPFREPYDVQRIALQLDVSSVLELRFLPILLTLFLMSFLDTLGTLVGVSAATGAVDRRGRPTDIERPMLVDAGACVASALLGTSTSGAYIESAAGIREGARTGLASVVTAALFLGSLFFLPLFEPLQRLRFAYAPPLIVVGLLMLGAIRQIDFDDITEAAPAFATIAMMVFSYNIANGLTAGLVLYPIVKLLAGRWHEVSSGAAALAALCGSYYLFGLPH